MQDERQWGEKDVRDGTEVVMINCSSQLAWWRKRRRKPPSCCLSLRTARGRRTRRTWSCAGRHQSLLHLCYGQQRKIRVTPSDCKLVFKTNWGFMFLGTIYTHTMHAKNQGEGLKLLLRSQKTQLVTLLIKLKDKHTPRCERLLLCVKSWATYIWKETNKIRTQTGWTNLLRPAVRGLHRFWSAPPNPAPLYRSALMRESQGQSQK